MNLGEGGRRRRCVLAVWVAWNVVLAGCSGVPPHPDIGALEPGFSKQGAQAHFEALASIGPRLPGSGPDETARAYLDREFRLTGARVEVEDDGTRRHLIAEIPGRSEDVLLFVAAYPTLGSEGAIDDSGAVLLLELARVLGQVEPPYSLRFALAEVRVDPVEEPDSRAQGIEDAVSSPSAEGIRDLLIEAGRGLAKAIDEAEDGLDRLRAVFVFEIAARSEMRFDRDLRSHPVFREIFWESAASLGRGAMFPPEAGWFSPRGLHEGFRERSMDRVLVLVDVSNASQTTRTDEDSARSGREEAFDGVEALGVVTVDAVNRLMRRFEKVDAFSD